MKKLILGSIVSAMLLVASTGCSPAVRGDRDTVFHVSTISALMQGVFNGDVTVGQLRHYGDVGLGTFQDLDGEMIVLDNIYYRAMLDGTIEAVGDDELVPFGAFTFFNRDAVYVIDKQLDIDSLKSYMDSVIPSMNIFYVFKIEGKFSYVKTRSVPAQKKPYPKLIEVTSQSQIVSEFNDVEGTVVGFWSPPHADGVSITGYHLHFINKDRSRGGHVMDLKTENVQLILDYCTDLIVHFPDNSEFLKADMVSGEPEGLKQVEQGK